MTKRDESADKQYEVYLRNGEMVQFYAARFSLHRANDPFQGTYDHDPGDSSRRLLWVDPAEIVAVVVVDDGESERPGEEGE